MNKHKKRGNSILIVIGIIITSIVVILTIFNPCKGIGCITFESDEKYRLSEVYQDDKEVFSALYKHNSSTLRLSVLHNTDSEKAKLLNKTQISKISSFFENDVSPYPGEISNEIMCDEQYKPELKSKFNNDFEISYFLGYLNERYVFGACTEEQIAYKGTLALFYCKNTQNFIQAEFIVDKNVSFDQLTNKLNSLRCN